MSVYAFHVLTEEEKEQHFAIVEAPTPPKGWIVNHSWLMKVMYKTEYGLYSSDLTPVTILP